MYAIIAGGGKVGFFLARELIEHGHEVLIIEQNSERAEFIANELGNVVLRLRNTDVWVVEAVVDNRSKAIGKPLRDLNMPPESTISVVIRNGSAFFPNGATILEPGDEVVALTRSVHEPNLRSLFFSE